MATFISKEEIMQGVRDVPALMGQAPASPTSIFSPSPLGPGNTLDKIERILTQINSIVDKAQAIRNNPMIKAALPAQEMPLTLPPPGSSGNPPISQPRATAPPTSSMPPQPQNVVITQRQAPPELNIEGAKGVIADFFKEIENSSPEIQKTTLADALARYNSPLTKGILEGLLLQKLQDNLGRLIK